MLALRNGKWWALGGVALAVLAVGLDGTILNVALPTLSRVLSASESDLIWFSSAYLLALAAAMLPAGVLGDRFGRKKVMVVALTLFGLASIVCAYSTSTGEFIAARAVLGATGAAVTVMAISALTVLFSEKERPRAVGIWAAANFLALPLGPLLGGWLLTHFWWGWVFLINVPVVALGIAALALLVPESRAPQGHRIDGIGIVGFAGGLVSLTFGFVEAAGHGWLAALTVIPLIVGVVLLIAFVLWERRLGAGSDRAPLVDLALFRIRSFTWGIVLAAIASLTILGILFTIPQYFQGVRGLDAIDSGVRLLPLIAGLVAGAAVADNLAKAIGAGRVAGIGFTLVAIGLYIGSVSLDASGWVMAAWMVVAGLGIGFTLSTTTSAALSQVPHERSGVAATVMQALQEVGGPFGAAILGGALLSTYEAGLQLATVPERLHAAVRDSVFGGDAVARRLHDAALLSNVHSSFVAGLGVALLIMAIIAAAGAALALVFLPGARTASSVNPGQEEAGVPQLG
jgi:MFS transporter, DHA2 family, multidrug resistance protein